MTAPWGTVPHVLDGIQEFLERYVVYPHEHAAVAHTLWIAHTWLMDRWDSTPRIAFISKEPGSGKSRALEVTAPLVPRHVHAVNATPAYLFRKVSDPAGPPTILFDEIDTIFGPRAKDNEEIRGMLNAGHRRGATAGRALVKGKEVVTEELPAYSSVALAGLNDLPDTLRARSVVIQMRRRAPNETVKPWRMRDGEAEAAPLKHRLEQWTQTFPATISRWPETPPAVQDRDADVWEALLAVADHAGGHWPQTARAAATAIVTESKERPQTLGVQLLGDLHGMFTAPDNAGRDRFGTEEILEHLNGLDESPWGNIRGNPLDSRGLARRLRGYGIRPQLIRDGGDVYRGYLTGDFQDSFARYLPDGSAETPPAPWAPQDTSVTGVTTVTTAESSGKNRNAQEHLSVTKAPIRYTRVTDKPRNHAEVTPVTLVTHKSGGTYGQGKTNPEPEPTPQREEPSMARIYADEHLYADCRVCHYPKRTSELTSGLCAKCAGKERATE